MCNCQELVKLKFSRKHEGCKLPTKRHGDAGRDIYIDPNFIEDFLFIGSLETVLLPTGLRSIIPPTHYAQIQERGSTGVNGIKYSAGVLDSNYRGEWNVVITNCNSMPLIIYNDKKFEDKNELYQILSKQKGVSTTWAKTMYKYYPLSKAIAQFVILPVPNVNIEEVSESDILSDVSERGEGKLGSSGK